MLASSSTTRIVYMELSSRRQSPSLRLPGKGDRHHNTTAKGVKSRRSVCSFGGIKFCSGQSKRHPIAAVRLARGAVRVEIHSNCRRKPCRSSGSCSSRSAGGYPLHDTASAISDKDLADPSSAPRPRARCSAGSRSARTRSAASRGTGRRVRIAPGCGGTDRGRGPSAVLHARRWSKRI